MNDKVRNLIFFAEGGIGKNICATAVVRAVKKAHPDKNIIVVAGCPEVFINNPNVKRVFNFNNALHFYEDWINDESCVLRVEPYLHYEYIQKKKHLTECWCELLDVPCDGIEPDIYFTPNELEAAKLFTEDLTENGKNELAIIQWVGGKIPEPKNPKSYKQCLAEMYRRAMPTGLAQDTIDYFVESRGWSVLNCAHPNFPSLNNCKTPSFPIRSTISLLTQAKVFVGIDSFLQHAAAARQINKKGIVIWGGTTPKCLGYDLHVNMTREACPTPFCHRPNSYLLDVQANGMIWDCSHGEPCMKRDKNEIIVEIEKLVPVDKHKKKEKKDEKSKKTDDANGNSCISCK